MDDADLFTKNVNRETYEKHVVKFLGNCSEGWTCDRKGVGRYSIRSFSAAFKCHYWMSGIVQSLCKCVKSIIKGTEWVFWIPFQLECILLKPLSIGVESHFNWSISLNPICEKCFDCVKYFYYIMFTIWEEEDFSTRL